MKAVKPALVLLDTKRGIVRRYIPKPAHGMRPHGNYYEPIKEPGPLPPMGDSLEFIENYRVSGA
jgi:hypothetical protein